MAARPHSFLLSRFIGVLPPLFVAFALAGCGAEDPVETPRPVLVARATSGGPAGGTAYAGEVRAREESPLAFRVGGKLVRRNVDVGDHVREGQVLAVLDPGDLAAQAAAAQAQLAAAEAELARASGDRQRYAALAEDQLVSRSALDAQTAAAKAAQGQVNAARAQLRLARNQTGYSELRAPSDGVIASRTAEAGQVVAAGQTVFTLAADGAREVAIALPETRIRDFRVGQPARVELWSAPGEWLQGRIREIAPAADPQARTYAARIALTPAGAERVALGQSARVHVQDDGQRAAMAVPLSAVQRGAGGATTVWVVDPATRKLRATPVRLGPFGETTVPVLSGLPSDAWVVAAGGHLLREGQVVAPVDRQNRPVLDRRPSATATASTR